MNLQSCRAAAVALFACLIVNSAARASPGSGSPPVTPGFLVPLGLPSFEDAGVPAPDARRVALGRRLFFDARLSGDGTISCASCHEPTRAFTDGRPRAVGLRGQEGTRNAPSLLNVAYQETLFWDGRAPTLEAQALLPFTNAVEHGLADLAQVERTVRRDVAYRSAFQEAFGLADAAITAGHVALALAAFERSLLSGDSPFDRYYYGGDSSALSADAIAGLVLFQGRAGCASCHTIGATSALFTDQQFHPATLGVGASALAALRDNSTWIERLSAQGRRGEIDALLTRSADVAALGRFVVTRTPRDVGMFKTPSLRNVARTAPYLHAGQLATLEQVVDAELYQRNAALKYPVALTSLEKRQLVAFLESLTSAPAPRIAD